MVVGKLRFAIREDRLAGLATAVDIAAFDLQRVAADLIVAQHTRAFGHEQDHCNHQQHGNGKIISRRYRNDTALQTERPCGKFYLWEAHGANAFSGM
ncbi:hypothetical protein D3C72_2202690 [compost metagenome]